MPHEEQPANEVPEIPLQEDEGGGPWGAISPTPHSIETLCLNIEVEPGKPRIYYYPYRTMGKWNWSMGSPETLEIQLGGVQLTVSGTGLRRLAEALNLGQLRLVQLNQPPVLEGEICIQAIFIEDLTT